MLSNDDLHAIGSLIDVKFDAKFDEKIEPVLEAIREGFEMTATKAELSSLGTGLRAEMLEMRHELMDHTDRTVGKAVGDLRVELKGDIGGLRAELRERDLIG